MRTSLFRPPASVCRDGELVDRDLCPTIAAAQLEEADWPVSVLNNLLLAASIRLMVGPISCENEGDNTATSVEAQSTKTDANISPRRRRARAVQDIVKMGYQGGCGEPLAASLRQLKSEWSSGRLSPLIRRVFGKMLAMPSAFKSAQSAGNDTEGGPVHPHGGLATSSESTSSSSSSNSAEEAAVVVLHEGRSASLPRLGSLPTNLESAIRSRIEERITRQAYPGTLASRGGVIEMSEVNSAAQETQPRFQRVSTAQSTLESVIAETIRLLMVTSQPVEAEEQISTAADALADRLSDISTALSRKVRMQQIKHACMQENKEMC